MKVSFIFDRNGKGFREWMIVLDVCMVWLRLTVGGLMSIVGREIFIVGTLTSGMVSFMIGNRNEERDWIIDFVCEVKFSYC